MKKGIDKDLFKGCGKCEAVKPMPEPLSESYLPFEGILKELEEEERIANKAW